MELFQANQQWSTRPEDERFWSINELFATVNHFRHAAVEAEVQIDDLSARADGDEILLASRTGNEAGLTNHSFAQLAATSKSPAAYLRTLPAPLAADCINTGLRRRDGNDDPRSILFRQNGGLRAHAIVSPRYGRIWNNDIASRLMDLESSGIWKVPPARPSGQYNSKVRIATEADVLSDTSLSLSVRPGDTIAPAGVYASDRDMFVFMVSDNRVDVPGAGSLRRGFFVSNSEVGERAFRVTCFLLNDVCGNHIVWGARDVVETKVIHRGDEDAVALRAFDGMQATLDSYLNQDTSTEREVITTAMNTTIADDREKVVAALHQKQIGTKPMLNAAYGEAEQHPEDGHTGANTVWGMVQGITRESQKQRHQGARDAMDKAAGKLLSITF